MKLRKHRKATILTGTPWTSCRLATLSCSTGGFSVSVAPFRCRRPDGCDSAASLASASSSLALMSSYDIGLDERGLENDKAGTGLGGSGSGSRLESVSSVYGGGIDEASSPGDENVLETSGVAS
jgi:hypothetical protein